MLKPININEFITALEKIMLPLEASEEKYSDAILKVMTIIHNHYTEALSLDSLAEEVHLAPAYLSRTFIKEIGIGINQFITSLRIEKAKKLLTASTLKINQIAKDSGFESSSYFNRVFTGQVGISPTEYRQRDLPPA